MSGLGTELERLRDGRSTFAAFAASTGADWRRIAEHLRRRWIVPPAVEAADVEQELLLSAWRATEGWDPSRGVALETHVVWNAIRNAKRMLSKQRNAKRLDERAPGRFPVAFSNLPNGEEPRGPASDATAEEMAEAREQLSLVLGERTNVERAVLASVVASGGDLDRAARMVFSDPGLCLRARVGSEREARRLTARVVKEVLEAAASRGSDER